MKNLINKKLKGITLIESLIYMAIFGILFLTTMQFMFVVEENNHTAIIRTKVDRNSLFLDEHLTYSIDNTVSIDSVNSTFDNDNGVLRLDIGGVANTYSINSGRLIINKNSTNYFLTSPDMTVERFRVTQILDSASNLSGVRVEITLRSNLDNDVNKIIENAYFL